MNIIMPVGGKGERFIKCGYNSPKPLIKIFEKEMIFYVIDNLNLNKDDKLFIIHYNLEQYDFVNILKKKYSHIIFVQVHKQTKGASETIYIGLEQIIQNTNNKKCIIMDCDTFYTEDILELYRNVNSNAVFYTLNYEKNPIYSYIELNDKMNVLKIREKEKISNNANTGIYCFCDINELYNYAKYVVDNNVQFSNECYTSCIIDNMLNDNKSFIGIELNNKYVFNLGTPEQLNNYIKNTYLFLFDLDGTLVLTDDIYFDVWKDILKKYNVELTHDIFKNYIQGNSDSTVLRSLLPNKYNELLSNISIIKDELFLPNINKLKIIDGVIEFLQVIKQFGHKLAVVTNCNRNVAEEIIKYINIDKIIDKLIIGNECDRGKPFPDPYLRAINYFNSNNEKAIIFEDSKTGIQSGKGVFPKLLIGIETLYDSNELLNNGVDMCIKNYLNIDINNLLNYSHSNIEKLKSNIKLSMRNLNIMNIELLNHKLKGGFISDVIGLEIYTDDKILDCVLKLENKNETFLSKMANDLGLYEREYYFYNSLSNYVPIKIPEFYGLIKNENYDNIGILMNNLINLNYKLNLNLNNEKIDVSLKIIERLAQLHANFWNKDLQNKFKELKKHNDSMFNPKWANFVKDKWEEFKNRWACILSEKQMNKAQWIVDNFQDIQNKLSDNNLTLCHGDVKSANIFYKQNGDEYEPYFIDWQYICYGKGVQDLVFFMIESFEIDKINKCKGFFKDYYYIKLQENDVLNYSRSEYETDFENAIYYFPFFVAMWFGTIDEDELVDKNFPFFFIQRLFNFIN